VLNSGGERYRTTITLIIVVDVKLVMLGSTWHLALGSGGSTSGVVTSEIRGVFHACVTSTITQSLVGSVVGAELGREDHISIP
jgi:hypothetical protein